MLHSHNLFSCTLIVFFIILNFFSYFLFKEIRPSGAATPSPGTTLIDAVPLLHSFLPFFLFCFPS